MKDFDQVITLLQEYKEQHGDCLVPLRYVTEDGIRLGQIVSSIRSGQRKTSVEEKAMLDSLGFVWKAKRGSSLSFEEVIKLLQEYKEKHGDCLVPSRYVTENGICLGWIVNHIRTGARKTSEEEKAKLDSLGFVWKVNESPLSFDQVIRLLQEYKEQHGDCLVPVSYTTEDGIRLGSIVNTIRSGARKTSAEEKAKLDSLGFVWNARESVLSFEEVIKLLQEYNEQHGNYLVPSRYVTEDGIRLGDIVHNIRKGSRKTNEEEKAMLDNLGFVWKVRKGRKN